MRIITVSDVRRTCGITDSLIDDDDVQRTIERAVIETERELNTALYPRTTIEIFSPGDASDPSVHVLKHIPILQIKSVKAEDTDVSAQYVKVNEGSGIVTLTSDAEKRYFDTSEPNNNAIKYIYGYLRPNKEVETLTTAAITTPAAGTSVSVTAGEGSQFEVNDWVRIEGMDKYFEVTKVTAVAANSITCDISYPHEDGSRVILMETPGDIKRLVEINTSLMLIAREVGASFKDIVGYTLGGKSIQKGEPYTQWRETHVQLVRERDMLLKSLRRMPAVG